MTIRQLRYDTRDNTYKYTNAKYFSPQNRLWYGYIMTSYAFAYNMSFSEEGYHRRHRSGGTNCRSNVEVFCDAFLGKLGEFSVYQLFKSHNIPINYPDINIMGQSEWDNYDFIYMGRKIGVKTTKSFGNLLLLETKDWNQNGQYLPNIRKNEGDYDDMLFVRVKTDIVSNLKNRRLYYSDSIDVNFLQEELFKSIYEFDISYVSIGMIREAINNNIILKRGESLQKREIKMDADNYYIQSGDMIDIDEFIQYIKSIC